MRSLDEYVSGGYVLSRWVGRVDCTATTLRRTTVACDHTQRVFFPDSWTIGWTSESRRDRIEAAARFLIPESRLDELVADVTARFGASVAPWNLCADLDTARALRRTYLAGVPDVELWGLGLHRTLAAAFLEGHRPPPRLPGYAPVGRTGVCTLLLRNQPLAPGGTPLGHEMLVYDCAFNSLESLHGNEADVLARLGVAANPLGLVDDFPEARRCADEMNPPSSQDEPADCWTPWLLASYPLEP